MKHIDWNERYNNGDKPWDKGAGTPALEELMRIAPQYFQTDMRALVPGCGVGHDVAMLHDAGVDAYGLDISETALKLAREAYPTLGDVWLKDDLFKMEHASVMYDLVWEHTCYCAIPPETRDAYVKAVFDLLKPGAYLAGVFFTETGQPPEVGPPFSTTRDDMFVKFNSSFDLEWEGKPTQSYPGREDCEWLMVWRKPS